MKALVSVLLLVAASSWADPGFAGVFGPSAQTPGLQMMNRGQVAQLLAAAAHEHWNLFDLIDEGGLWLKAQGRRVRIAGADLRALTAQFDLGDTRIDALVPLAVLDHLDWGQPPSGGADVEIVLTKPVSDFLELGTFFLADHYGFRSLKDKELGDAFGLRVQTGLLTFDIAKIARVPDPTGHHDPNFIAIHAWGFLRPKQWQIDPVRLLPGPSAKP